MAPNRIFIKKNRFQCWTPLRNVAIKLKIVLKTYFDSIFENGRSMIKLYYLMP